MSMNLWDHINKRGPNDCWEWRRGKNFYGYGVMRKDGKVQIVTRVVWQEVHGYPPGALCVCHTCDNRACCNPAHLFLGTREDNLHDMCRKGRHGRGNLKLSDQAVREVLANPQASVGELATRYSVSRSLIYIIRQGKHRNPDKPLFEFRGEREAA